MFLAWNLAGSSGSRPEVDYILESTDEVVLSGEDPLKAAQHSTQLAAQIETLKTDRDLVLEEFPSLCMGVVQCSTDEVIARQAKFHAEEWEQLIENKLKFSSFITYQLTVYKTIEVISQKAADSKIQYDQKTSAYHKCTLRLTTMWYSFYVTSTLKT